MVSDEPARPLAPTTSLYPALVLTEVSVPEKCFQDKPEWRKKDRKLTCRPQPMAEDETPVRESLNMALSERAYVHDKTNHTTHPAKHHTDCTIYVQHRPCTHTILYTYHLLHHTYMLHICTCHKTCTPHCTHTTLYAIHTYHTECTYIPQCIQTTHHSYIYHTLHVYIQYHTGTAYHTIYITTCTYHLNTPHCTHATYQHTAQKAHKSHTPFRCTL